MYISTILSAIILGIVEGVTEFLPISSTGHLILINQFVSFSSQKFNLLFDIVIQLGAILAVLVLYFKKLWPLDKQWKINQEVMHIWYKTMIGVVPAIAVGALFASKIQEKLFNPFMVALALLVGGYIILKIEKKNPTDKIKSIKELSIQTALFIGLIQCLSFIPGVSRSGATIIGALFLGASRVVATEFSFFLAIPTMVAASVWSLLKYKAILTLGQVFILGVGFVVSFIVAMLVIKFFVNYIEKNNFTLFGKYRIILGIIILIAFYL